MTWDLLCGPGIYGYTVGDCTDMLEDLVSARMYQAALIMLKKLEGDILISRDITRVVSRRLCGDGNDEGFITECIEEIRQTAERSNGKSRMVMI